MRLLLQLQSLEIWHYEPERIADAFVPGYASSKARKEYLASRELLALRAGGFRQGEDKKWRNAQGEWLSLSHCGNYIAFARSSVLLGVDIQSYEPRLVRLLARLCPEEQYQRIAGGNEELLLWHWTAREALYKVLNKGIALDYRRDIELADEPPRAGEQAFLVLRGQEYFTAEIYFGIWGACCLVKPQRGLF